MIENPKLKPLIIISVDQETKQLVVHAPMQNKRLCLNALADALKTVADFGESDMAVQKEGGENGKLTIPGA